MVDTSCGLNNHHLNILDNINNNIINNNPKNNNNHINMVDNTISHQHVPNNTNSHSHTINNINQFVDKTKNHLVKNTNNTITLKLDGLNSRDTAINPKPIRSNN